MDLDDEALRGLRRRADGRMDDREFIVFPDDFEDAARKVANWIRFGMTQGPWTYGVGMQEPIRRWVVIEVHGVDGLRLESPGSQSLHGADRLTPEEEATLGRLGWEPPDSDPRRSGNWWREWLPAAVEEPAALVATTLFAVHRYASAKRYGSEYSDPGPPLTGGRPRP